MAEGAIFLDILGRLDMASFVRVFKQAEAASRDGGKASSRAFSEGFSLDGAKSQFGELVEASRAAYRDMASGLQGLQIQEARINDLRARNFKQSSEVMIAAQRDFDAALANSMKLMEASSARQAELRAVPVPTGRGGRGEEPEPRGRSVPVPLARAGRIAGAGAAIGLAGGAYEGSRIAVDVQSNLNQIQAQQRESASDIKTLHDSIYQIAQRTGIKPGEIAKAYGNISRATDYQTGQGYRGAEAVNAMTQATQLSRVVPGLGLDEAIQAITTTSHDYRIKLEDATALLAAGSKDVKGSMDDFANSLHSIEPAAQLAGIKPGEIIAALGQMSQTGQTSQQSAPNLANLLKNLSAPGPAQSKRMSQYGINPEDISSNFAKRGLAGTLGTILDQVTKDMGPDGLVKLQYAYQNQLEEGYQQQDFDKLSPELQNLIQTDPVFNKSEISGSPKLLKKELESHHVDVSDTDIPILQDYLKKQKELHGPNSKIRSESPDVMSGLGVFTDIAGGKDAGRALMMLAGNQGLLGQYQERETKLGQEGTPNAFNDAFNQAMQSDKAKFEKLGASAEALAGKMGEHLLPILGRVADDLNGFVDFLDRNKIAMDAFIAAVSGAAAAFVATKLKLPQLAKWGWDTFKPNYQGGYGTPNPIGGAAGSSAELDGAFSALSGAAGALNTSAAALKEAAAGLKGAASAEDSAAAKEGESATALDGSAGRLDAAAGALEADGERMATGAAGALSGALPGLIAGAMGSQMVHDAAQHYDQTHGTHVSKATNDPLTQFGPWLFGQGKNFIDNKPVTMDIPGFGNVQIIGGAPEKHSLGGIVGFKAGSGELDPYSQPLMGQRDTGGDSILGTLGGKPVGLRGGEGILTPEAVARLGGKDTVDGLNAGEDPWADPLKVGSTFFGSFSTGVAKYAPAGKYLTAASHTLDDMVKAFDTSTKEHEKGGGRNGLPKEIEEMIASGMSQEDILQTLGATKGKRGGYELPSGQYLSNKDKMLLGLPITHRGEKTPQGGTVGVPGSSSIGPGAEKWRPLVEQIAAQRGVSSAWVKPLLAQISTESGGDPRSINDHDSDGRGGTQTVEGLFNFLPSTFAASGGGNIFDPATQINNAITYGLGKPGSNRQQPQGFGYGQGWAGGGIVGYEGGTSNVGGGISAPSLDNSSIAPPDHSVPAAPALPGKSSPIGSTPGTTGSMLLPGQTKPPPGGPPAPLMDSYMQSRLAGQGVGANAGGTGPQGGPADKPDESLTSPGTKPGDYGNPTDDRNVKESPSQGVGTTTSKGFGISGGLIGAAEGAATMAAGMSPAGPAGSAATQMMFQLANRAIGYAGQLVGIGLEGLTETFLPHDSPKTQASSSLFGKIALGIAGAHPGPENMSAMGSALQLKPKDDLDQGAAQAGQVMPMVQMHNTTINHNGGDVSGQMQKGITQALFGAGQLGG
jgi:TP901 family phage tail tape measure protein